MRQVGEYSPPRFDFLMFYTYIIYAQYITKTDQSGSHTVFA